MWGRSKVKRTQQLAEIAVARAAQDRADAVIAHVESQDEEISQIVHRLERREKANNFGASLMKAMEKRR